MRSYNAYREICGFKTAEDFDDLIDVFHPEVMQFTKHLKIKKLNDNFCAWFLQLIKRFKELYSSVDDIDLFIAGVNEAKVKGAYVGPTFQCMIAYQFLNLKRGDRYFYDLEGQPGSFTKGMTQLHKLVVLVSSELRPVY